MTVTVERVGAPVVGTRAGLHTLVRRWLFFRVGHAGVMDATIHNIAALG